MCLEMIKFPLRIVACATSLGVRVTEKMADVALGLTRRLIEAAGPDEPDGRGANGEGESSGLRVGVIIASSPSTFETPSAPPSAQDAPDLLTTSAPTHISEDLQFVGGFRRAGRPGRRRRRSTRQGAVERLFAHGGKGGHRTAGGCESRRGSRRHAV
jgi:hypothetical protein